MDPEDRGDLETDSAAEWSLKEAENEAADDVIDAFLSWMSDEQLNHWLENPGLRASLLRRLRPAVHQLRVHIVDRCAVIASEFSMRGDRRVHPDIPWERMNESAQTAAHSTAQQIAMRIRERGVQGPLDTRKWRQVADMASKVIGFLVGRDVQVIEVPFEAWRDSPKLDFRISHTAPGVLAGRGGPGGKTRIDLYLRRKG
jgi:hypothetical protein